jgi:hypothetical protein
MIPLATTTIAVLEIPADVPAEGEDYRDPYDAQPDAVAAVTGVRARIGQPSGTEQVAGGAQELINAVLWCDPIELTNDSKVLDESTGLMFEVAAVFQQRGLGLDHTKAWLRRTTGVS